MAMEPLETMEGYDDACVRQQSVFVENHVGQLLRLAKLFDRTDIRILAVSVVYSCDCAIARMILDDPDRGHDLLAHGRYPVSEAELVVVSLPHGKRALLHTWAALLAAEISIHYTYPLLIHPRGSAALAVAPDDLHQCIQVLTDRGFEILTQQDLRDARDD